MSSDQSEGTTGSGKYYKTNKEGDISVYSLVRNSTAHSPPTTPPSTPHRGKNSPVPPPPEDKMASHMKLPTFKGVGDKDMDRSWFFTESVWTEQNVANDAMKRAQLFLSFEGRALDWYMGYAAQHVNETIQEVKHALKQ